MSRDSTNDDSNNNNNNNNNNSSSEQFNGIIKNNLNETSTIVNGSIISDDAVVATSTLPNPDDSVTAVDDPKSRDEWTKIIWTNKSAIEEERNIEFLEKTKNRKHLIAHVF